MNNQEALQKFRLWMVQKRLARRTIENYLGHANRYGRFKPAYPCATTEDRVSSYLSHLAETRTAVTQKQALNALVNLYRALDRPLGQLPAWVSPRIRNRAKAWTNAQEATAIIRHLPEPWNEVASMLFGSGLRIHECISLRVKDLDLDMRTVVIHGGKGDKDRVVPLAHCMVEVLRERIEVSRAVWQEDRANHRPGIHIPDSFVVKSPRAGERWEMFWLWPAPGESTDPETGVVRRHHRHEDGFAKALRPAVDRAKVNKRVTAHSFRHGFATEYLNGGGNIQDLKELMGHTHISVTESYLHCIPKLSSRALSPLDAAMGISEFRKSA